VVVGVQVGALGEGEGEQRQRSVWVWVGVDGRGGVKGAEGVGAGPKAGVLVPER